MEQEPGQVEGQNIDSQYLAAVQQFLDAETNKDKKDNLTKILKTSKLPKEFKDCVIQAKPSKLNSELVRCLRNSKVNPLDEYVYRNEIKRDRKPVSQEPFNPESPPVISSQVDPKVKEHINKLQTLNEKKKQQLEEQLEKNIDVKKKEKELRDKLAKSSEERKAAKATLANASEGGSRKTNRRKSKRKSRGKKKSRRIRRKQ